MAFFGTIRRKQVAISILFLILLALLYHGYFINQRFTSTNDSVMKSKMAKQGSSVGTILSSNTTNPPLIIRTNLHRFYGLDEIYENRRAAIEDTCDKSNHGYFGNSDGAKVVNRLVIDRQHHLVYCPVQKIGSTFLKGLLQILKKQGKKNLDTRKIREKPNTSPDMTQFHYYLTKSFKVMFTRDPYYRLFAGYVDKLFTVNTLFWQVIGTYIKNTLLRPENDIRTKCGHGITFPQFIKYVIASQKTGVHTDGHFTPIYEHCRPCQISYDFIGKMETFENDSLTLLNVWNKRYGANITYDDFEMETTLQRVRGMINRLYKMRKEFKKCVSVYGVLQRVWKDFQIRGFLTTRVNLPFSRSEAANISAEQMTAVVIKAILEHSTNRTELLQQRNEAISLAYSQVPMKDLVELREIVRPDCELFGYNVSPDYIFNRGDPSDDVTSYRYFDIDE